MKKLFTTLGFLISFTLFSQSIIEVNYSKLDNTTEDKYEKVGDWNIKIDLQYDKNLSFGKKVLNTTNLHLIF